MTRALIAALTLALLVPTGAVAQDDEGDWPTACELRRELQSIGYEFGFVSAPPAWHGGRALRNVTIRDLPDGAAVDVRVDANDFYLGWGESTTSGLSAAMEVLSILPTDHPTRMAVLFAITDAEDDKVACLEHRLARQELLVVQRWDAEGGWVVSVWPASRESYCDDPRPLLDDLTE